MRRPRGNVRAESRARYYIRDEARKRGWDTSHVNAGGNFLEENEIVSHFPNIGLGLDKPDFLICVGGEPAVVVEAKNETGKLGEAIEQAKDYAALINATGRYNVKIAVGAAGEMDKGFMVDVQYLSPNGWTPLTFRGYDLTTVPSFREVETALGADDGTTAVSVPASYEFIDAAVELSSLLRQARVEAPLRPKVIGAVVLALYQGTVDTSAQNGLQSINDLAATAIGSFDGISGPKKQRLIDALRLSGADFERLSPAVNRIVSVLRRLNVRSVLHTDTDFLGLFYEAFLRYGYDNNALGIVFTPRHITRFCADLVGVSPVDRVVDIASGTGGFLVAAYDKMIGAARSPAAIEEVKSSLYGFDTNPTVWALAMLNMFFRGDGKSHIEHGSCLDAASRTSVRRGFTRAFLNPPFSQEGEPERDFIDAAMEALRPEGLLASVVKAGIFADDEHKGWRRNFLRNHSILAMISLPEDLFYPTAAPTSIVVSRAHVPQPDDEPVLMARVWNDGYEKLKSRRVARQGDQLPEVKQAFDDLMVGRTIATPLAVTVDGRQLKNGAEWSPQQWLPQPHSSPADNLALQSMAIRSVYQAVAQYPDLADETLFDFCTGWVDKPDLPLGTRGPVTDFFNVYNGKSSGEKNYADGPTAYVSSGDASNSIVRLVAPVEGEVFELGGVTVTAFGAAAIQPWPFLARGNGGSAVRVLLPKYNLSFRELAWFTAQINLQRWRFFYARMSIKSRLEQLQIESPAGRLADPPLTVAGNINAFRDSLLQFSSAEAPAAGV